MIINYGYVDMLILYYYISFTAYPISFNGINYLYIYIYMQIIIDTRCKLK